MKNRNFTKADLAIVSYQLKGRKILMAGVAGHCHWGCPAVIFIQPDADSTGREFYTPVATPLWLTCPFLNRKIHDLESKGLIRQLESRLLEDPEFAAAMAKAHQSYSSLRKDLLTGTVPDTPEAEKRMNSGIGGIENRNTLKCLHLHAAHYMSCAANAAGKAVWELLGETHCSDAECLKHL